MGARNGDGPDSFIGIGLTIWICCSPPAKSACVRSMVGKRSPSSPSSSPLTWRHGGLLSMSRSDEDRRFAAECLKRAQTAEEEQNRATFLQMAPVWFALAEREEARSRRNDHPEDQMPFLPASPSASSATFVQAARLRPGSKECEVSKLGTAFLLQLMFVCLLARLRAEPKHPLPMHN